MLMSEHEISTGAVPINFGATGVEEIKQNVRMILTTPQFSCPLFRDFAWNPEIDAPINIQQAKITSRLIAAIRKYEPRARPISVSFQGDGLSGVLKPTVRIAIKEDLSAWQN